MYELNTAIKMKNVHDVGQVAPLRSLARARVRAHFTHVLGTRATADPRCIWTRCLSLWQGRWTGRPLIWSARSRRNVGDYRRKSLEHIFRGWIPGARMGLMEIGEDKDSCGALKCCGVGT